MTAKEYLTARSEEIKALDQAINRKRERYLRQKARLTGGTAQLSGMPGGGGNDNAQFNKTVDLVAMAIEIDSDIVTLSQMQAALTAEISLCKHGDICAILEYRYVDRLSWSKIAAKMGYTRDGIYKLHGRALILFSAKLSTILGS